MFGDPLRVVNGYDSFGNVCGSDNMDMKKHKEALMRFSGHDVTGYRYVMLISPCHQETVKIYRLLKRKFVLFSIFHAKWFVIYWCLYFLSLYRFYRCIIYLCTDFLSFLCLSINFIRNIYFSLIYLPSSSLSCFSNDNISPSKFIIENILLVASQICFVL